MKAKTTEPTGTATTSQRDCRSRRSKLMRTLACHESRKLGLVMVSSRGRRSAPPRIGSLALRAAGDALHEPAHRVQLRDRHLLTLRYPQLPALVVERALELVER